MTRRGAARQTVKSARWVRWGSAIDGPALTHSRLPRGSLRPERGPCAGLWGHAGRAAVLPGKSAQRQGMVGGCFQGEVVALGIRGGSPCEAAAGNRPVVMGWETWRGAGQARWAHGVRDLRLGAEGPSKPQQ